MSKEEVKALAYHGINLKKQAGQLVGDCPFTDCQKEMHFYADPKTGRWDCKSCGRKGNIPTFLEQWHRLCLDETEKEDYQPLIDTRGLPVEAFLDYQVAWDGLNDRWIIPVRNEKGNIVSLGTWDHTDSKNIFCTAGMERSLLNLDRCKGKGPLYLCEGEWDCMALDWLRKRNKYRKPMDVMATPGTTFKESWVKFVKDRPLILLFDNDEPGEKLTDRIISLLQNKQQQIFRIYWPDECSEGYDIRDLVSESPRAFKKTWDDLQGLIKPIAETKKVLKPIHSFSTLIKKYKEHCYLSQSMIDSIAIMMGVVFSTAIPDDPAWMFVVERPSSGKTVFLEAMSKSAMCHFEDSISAKNLVSGWITPGKSHHDADEDDPSILRKVHKRTLIIKDFTAVLSKSYEEQEAIFGVLRNAFDGKVNQIFGNKIERRYPCHCSFLAGVTDEIYGHKTAEMGDRFLKLRLLEYDHDEEAHTNKGLDNSEKGIIIQDEISEVTERFLARDFNIKKLPKPPRWFRKQVVALARVVAYLRANVKRTRQGEIQYRPKPEMATRMAKQLTKLARGLAFVLGKNKIDERIYRLVCKVAWDTGYGWHRDILEVLIHKYPRMVPFNDIADLGEIAPTTLRRNLDNLVEFKIVKKTSIESGVPGKPQTGYKPIKEIVDLWHRAKLPKRRKT